MEALFGQIKQLASTASVDTRKTIITGLRDLMYSLESPDDTLQRLMFLPLEPAMVRVGIDMKLFNILTEKKEPQTIAELAQATGADPTLVGRVARYLSSHAIINESGKDTFAPNDMTKTLADPGNQAGIWHYFETVGPQFQAIPSFLKETKYQNPTDIFHTVLQHAFKTDLPAFQWFPQHPEAFATFNQHMASRRIDTSWLDVFPVEAETKGWSPEAPVFVDVGGGIGHQCAGLKGKYPDLPGRVYVQDLPHCIDHAIKAPGVEAMVYDFFTPQPIKGSKFYYLRGVIHDFPDDKAQIILKNIIDAMGDDSVILIDEMVLPDAHPHWQSTQIDLTMMCALAAMERTQSQFAELLDSVGLKVEKQYVYTPWVHETVLKVIRK
ncbi:hypothetical protein MMC25_007612 [Agyrium rufum]|nr:hypothetical protein [Agyrium rufum]